MTCVKKKEIIYNKRKEEREGTPITYSDATKKTTLPTTATQAKLPTPDMHITIIQCTYHAHFKNMINPGSYEKVVNEMFKANNLPTLKVPAAPQSEIITKLTKEMERNSRSAVQPQQEQQIQYQMQQTTQPE